ncbi:MAG TPA: hypothetical protein VL527_08675 [Dongiaceae bacterium]|nr:hypothetical protein [Dongiaceae bacterium]
MSVIRKIVLSLALCCSVVAAARAVVPETDWDHAGFFYDDSPLTLASGHRTEVLGPLYHFEQRNDQEQWAVCPLWSDTRNAVTDTEEFDFLYPLVTFDRFGTEYRFEVIQLFSFAGGQNQKEQTQRRFTIFPIYFQQRSPDPALNYTALFPIYGHLVGRPLNMKDDIRFVLFPLYSETRKRDVVTDNYFYPIFHLRHGDGLTGWQFWPLVGHEHKILTYQTNSFDTVTPVAGHDKWFALWPIFFDNHTGLDTTNAAWELSFLPAYSQLRSAQRDSTSVLWPFFNVINDHEKRYREWQLPYPFIVFSRGEGKTMSRVWPFFGRGHTELLEGDFYAWPLYQYRHLHSAPLDRQRTRVFFFLYSDVIQKNTETGKYLRRVDLFPFFTWHRDYNGDRRLQIIAPVEPFLPNNKSIERNYSPLWSLWRAETNATTGARSRSLLWNLYRHDTTPDTEKCSLLFGLFQYQHTPDGTRWRLFYAPVSEDRSPDRFEPVTATPVESSSRLEHPRYDLIPGAGNHSGDN